MKTYNKEQMIRIGGREWIHPSTGEIRIYINEDVWAPLVGFEILRYKSGNICHAEFNGSPVSNAKAGRVLFVKIYWTSTTSKIRIEQSAVFEEIIGTDVLTYAIDKAVRDSEPKPPADDRDNNANASAIVATIRTAGRTVREIAEMIGVSVSSVYRWARGICRPRPANFAALAAIA